MAPRADRDETRALVGALGVVAPPPIHVESPVFEGSLASLFVCVRERKIELTDVPLFPICQAYFEYLLTANLDNLDEAAAALTALSYLLERKAWSLLPVPEAEPEIYEEPLEIPPTVHEYGDIMTALRLWHEERSLQFFRPLEEGSSLNYELPVKLEDVSVLDLARAFEAILLRAEPEPFVPPHAPRISLGDVMAAFMGRMTKTPQKLEDIVPLPITRREAVFWFLALLELIRLAQVRVHRTDDDLQFAIGEA